MPVFLSATMHCCENHVSDFLVIASIGPDRLLLCPPKLSLLKDEHVQFSHFVLTGQVLQPLAILVTVL